MEMWKNFWESFSDYDDKHISVECIWILIWRKNWAKFFQFFLDPFFSRIKSVDVWTIFYLIDNKRHQFHFFLQSIAIFSVKYSSPIYCSWKLLILKEEFSKEFVKWLQFDDCIWFDAFLEKDAIHFGGESATIVSWSSFLCIYSCNWRNFYIFSLNRNIQESMLIMIKKWLIRRLNHFFCFRLLSVCSWYSVTRSHFFGEIFG